MATEGEKLANESLIKAHAKVDKEQEKLKKEREDKEEKDRDETLDDLNETVKKYVPDPVTGDDSPPLRGDPTLMRDAKKLLEAAKNRPLTLEDHLTASKLKERFSKLTD